MPEHRLFGGLGGDNVSCMSTLPDSTMSQGHTLTEWRMVAMIVDFLVVKTKSHSCSHEDLSQHHLPSAYYVLTRGALRAGILHILGIVPASTALEVACCPLLNAPPQDPGHCVTGLSRPFEWLPHRSPFHTGGRCWCPGSVSGSLQCADGPWPCQFPLPLPDSSDKRPALWRPHSTCSLHVCTGQDATCERTHPFADSGGVTSPLRCAKAIYAAGHRMEAEPRTARAPQSQCTQKLKLVYTCSPPISHPC